MKQEINLYKFLPKKTEGELTPKIVLGSYAAFFLLLLMFHVVGLWQKHRLTVQLEQLNSEVIVDQQQLATLKQKYPINDLAVLKTSIQQLQTDYENKTIVIDLLSPYANFSAYLIGLGNAIVPGVWLTEISINREGNKLALKGFTLHPTSLAQFYSRLSSQPIFSNLTFAVDEVKQKNVPASFYITAKKANKA